MRRRRREGGERCIWYPAAPQKQQNPDLIDLTEEDQDGSEDRLSPITVREQRVACARKVFGLHKDRVDRGDQAGQNVAENHRTTDVAKVLHLLHSAGDAAVRKALQRLHVNGTVARQSACKAS